MTERNRRVAIILAVIFAGGGVVCLICGVFGFFRMQQFVTEASEGATVTIQEADEFARTHDQAACRDESLRREDACGPTEMMCITQVSVFMQRCLDQCAPTPGFCDGVPPLTDIMASARWGTAQCTALGRPQDGRCPSMMQAVQRACERH